MIKKVWILIPAYNAGKTIESVFSRIPEGVWERIHRSVVVNDGSTDNTREVLKRLTERFPRLIVLEHPKNLGYGAAVKTLLSHALDHGCEIAIVLHADGQYSPEKIPDLLLPLERDEADLVQGSRMSGGGALAGGMPLYKFIANKILTGIENTAFGMKLAEYHSGYLLYSRRVLLEVPFRKLSDSFHFDLEMMITAHILGLRIKEVAIPTIYADEISHLNPIQYGFDVLGVVSKYLTGTYHSLLGIPRKRFLKK
jgi:glycosyltransferase involved in cell wall biosynthesis